ncbi:MAG: mannose-6-phosphate isomerase [Firmicutes bacterium HGW-Firmicutes-20]|jgi:mannose-6-phosphate isomerase|nr:MAG: mannose-6-phosphate isomerase [Firmicutes bacterium HGW-Firmicutes-20]PKM68440.1 MAG: mannose-6-phosphate isomerase [Firmicutes bacterium HGW-Firmicutes-19]
MKKQIVKVLPVYKERIWGGSKIKDYFHGNTEINPVGEMWNVSALPSGDCYVEELKKPLSQVFSDHPDWFQCETKEFPLHCTLIDPIADLSVQVHPTEEYARNVENTMGKPEAWYIIDAFKGATIQFGHTAKSKAEVIKRISDQQWDQLLNYVEVKKKDFLFVPDGNVHAISKNVLCFEIAKSADVTYRLYDYDRIDKKTGKKRELHIEKSLDVLVIPHTAPGPYTVKPERISGCNIRFFMDVPKIFTFASIEVEKKGEFSLDQFYFLTCIEGKGHVDDHFVHPGTTVLVPCDYGKISINGQLTLLLSSYRDH